MSDDETKSVMSDDETLSVLAHLGGQEVELYVRVRHPGPAPDEAPGLEVGGARRPGPGQEPLEPHLECYVYKCTQKSEP